MDDKAKIEELLRQGKIDSAQAALLTDALQASDDRQEAWQEQIRRQKSERTRAGRRLTLIGLLVVVIVTGGLLVAGGRQGPSRDERRALSYLNQAGQALQRQEYRQAEEFIRKGIQKDPGLPLSYSLLGHTQKLVYDQTGDPALLRQSTEAFEKAAALLSREKGGEASAGTGMLFLALFLLLFGGAVMALLLIVYNSLVSREEHANEAWAQVLTWYRRKLDLVPALMDAVRAYSQHEQQTLQAVVAARKSAGEVFQMADRGQAEPADLLASQKPLDAALGSVQALVEKYPDLKADAPFLTLQRQLEGAEDGIARSRMRFNHNVNDYNRGLRLFPANLVGAFFGFQPRRYFEPDPA
jgi:LemA protein